MQSYVIKQISLLPKSQYWISFFPSHSVLCLWFQIYKHIHKKHHEWTASVAFTSLYAHPLEHVVSNLLGPMLGPLICGSHIATAWLWYSLALMSTLNAHSGYHFPLFPSPEAHDFHHLKFNQCYGVLGILDYIHGTDTLFRSNKVIGVCPKMPSHRLRLPKSVPLL